MKTKSKTKKNIKRVASRFPPQNPRKTWNTEAPEPVQAAVFPGAHEPSN